jgi:hypothetical protein
VVDLSTSQQSTINKSTINNSTINKSAINNQQISNQQNQIDRQREPHEKLGVNSCAPESISRSCFTVASGVLLLSEERGKQAGSIFRANLYLVCGNEGG